MKRNTWQGVMLLVIASLVLSGCMLFQKNGELTGTVLYANDTPLVGAQVRIGGLSATTGAEGTFTVSEVKYGTHKLQVHFTGEKVHEQQVSIDKPQQSVTVKTAVEPEIGDISGTVLSPLGDPIADATVKIGDATVTTDAAGKFALTDVVYGPAIAQVTVNGLTQSVAITITTANAADLELTVGFYDHAGPPAGNLLSVNIASVEINETGFSATKDTKGIARDTTRSLDGEASLRIEGTKKNHGIWIASTFLPEIPGTYTFSAYVWGSPGDQVILQFQSKGPAGTGVEKTTSSPTFTLEGDKWERISFTYTVEPGGKDLDKDGESMGLLLRTPVDGDFEIWVDNLQLEQGDVATEWALPPEATNLLLYNQATADIDLRGFVGATGSGDAPEMTLDTAVALQGTSSLRLDGAGKGTREGVWLWSAFVDDDRGTYTFSAYFKGTPGDEFLLVFEEMGHAGTGSQTTHNGPTFTLQSDDWERHSFTVTMDTGMTLRPLIRHATAEPFTVWIDAMQLEKGDEATPWVSPPVPLGY